MPPSAETLPQGGQSPVRSSHTVTGAAQPPVTAKRPSSDTHASDSNGRAPASSIRTVSPTRSTRPKERQRQRSRKRQVATADVPAHTFNIGGLEISLKLMFIVIIGTLLAAMLMPSIYQWWRQEQDYRDITARVEAARARNADIERQLELWNTPEFVAAQARERLGYVMPGETQYSVVDPGPDYKDQAAVAAAAPRGPARPWVQIFAVLTSEADMPGEPQSATP